MRKVNIFLTCEHGGADVPAVYQPLFKKNKNVLKTHRALDIGALEIAKYLKNDLKVPLLYSKISRLIVDLNRVLTSRTLFSEFTTPFSISEKKLILKKYYFPHRDSFFNEVVLAEKKKQLLIHIGVHSFTPVLNNKKRKMQMALLYDPRRIAEKKFADLWINELKKQFPHYMIARNNPYKGASSGINDFFRRTFSAKNYIGIELEMNQGLLLELKKNNKMNSFAKQLSLSLAEAQKNLARTL